MGFNRQQRRKLQKEFNKQNKIEVIKDYVKQKAHDEIMDEIENTRVEILMNCFVIALHDEFGFGQQRCMKALNAIDALMQKFDIEELMPDDFRRIAEEKSGIRVEY